MTDKTCAKCGHWHPDPNKVCDRMVNTKVTWITTYGEARSDQAFMHCPCDKHIPR